MSKHAFPRLTKRSFDKLRRWPAVFLSYCCLRRALRSQHLLTTGRPALVVVTAESAMDLEVHKKAAEFLLLGRAEDYRDRQDPTALVHVIEESGRRKTYERHDLVNQYGKYRVILVLARSAEHLPVEMSAAADAVIELPKPAAAHIQAARRLLGRKPVHIDLAERLAGLDVVMLAPTVSRHDITFGDAGILRSTVQKPGTDNGPGLEDMPGYKALKPWARSFAADLEKWRSGEIAWSDLDRGILLHGPPGTGKTLFAKALARTCGIPLVAASVSAWQAQGHLGDLLAAMRATFEKARSLQPSIVFLDELDSIGDRTKFTGDHVGYQTQVVNSLLECIDGVEGRQGIVVVAATNHPEVIDRALLRSGRIEHHVRIELPNAEERAEILHFHLRGPVGVDELREMATDLKDWSAADLEKLARKARRQARAADRAVQIDDVAEALPPLETLASEIVRRAAAHESGHAVVALALQRDCRVSVSVRKQYRTFSTAPPAGGLTRYLDEPTDLDTRESLEAIICRALAGAAAEEVLLGSRSTGWGGSLGSDLHLATLIAGRMVCSLGMGKNLSFVMEDDHAALNRSGLLPRTAREEIDGILAEQFSRAKSIIVSRRLIVEALATELLERERLGPDDVKAIMEMRPTDQVEKWMGS